MPRFVSRDPYPGDLNDPILQNVYSYVSNNPVMYVDPNGKLKKIIKVEKFSMKLVMLFLIG
jgi:hypothetical protein